MGSWTGRLSVLISLRAIPIARMNTKSATRKLPGAPTENTGRTFRKARPLAARIGISTKTLFRWADAGLIHRHKVNSRVVLFDEAEVETFINGCRVA